MYGMYGMMTVLVAREGWFDGRTNGRKKGEGSPCPPYLMYSVCLSVFSPTGPPPRSI